MADQKKTVEERVGALGLLLGQHENRLGQLDQAAGAAQKTGEAAFAVAKKAADQLARHITECQAGIGGETEAQEETPQPPICPLVLDDRDEAAELLAELAEWLRQVYVRYPDHGLADCWAYHPWVVTELWALYRAWKLYHSQKSTDIGVLDWHLRYRKPIAQEIAMGLATCSLAKHTDPLLYSRPGVYGTEQLPDVATWYATSRYGATAPPQPDGNMVGLAKQREEQEKDRAAPKNKTRIPRA